MKKTIASLMLLATVGTGLGSGLNAANANETGAVSSTQAVSATQQVTPELEKAFKDFQEKNYSLLGKAITGVESRKTLEYWPKNYTTHYVVYEKNHAVYDAGKYGLNALYVNGAFQKYFGNADVLSDPNTWNWVEHPVALKGSIAPASAKVNVPGGQMQKFATIVYGEFDRAAPYYYDNTTKTVANTTEENFKKYGIPQNDMKFYHHAWNDGTLEVGTNYLPHTYTYVQDFINRATGEKKTVFGHAQLFGSPISTGINTLPADRHIYESYSVNTGGDIYWRITHHLDKTLPGHHTRGYGYLVSSEKAFGKSGAIAITEHPEKGVQTAFIWSEKTGTKTMNAKGAIYAHYLKSGGSDRLGYPTSDEHYDAKTKTMKVTFSSGKTIHWTQAKGAWTS